jgi:hypothetical protein
MNTGSTKLCAVITIAAGILVFAQTSLAQSDSTPTSRADVKAQTRAANKAGELYRGGEAPLPEKRFEPSKTRVERKAETITARKRGELVPPGEATYKAQLPMPVRSDKTRADRKAETLKAAKEGTLSPSGEAEDPAMVKTTPRRRSAN